MLFSFFFSENRRWLILILVKKLHTYYTFKWPVNFKISHQRSSWIIIFYEFHLKCLHIFNKGHEIIYNSFQTSQLRKNSLGMINIFYLLHYNVFFKYKYWLNRLQMTKNTCVLRTKKLRKDWTSKSHNYAIVRV